MGSSEVGGLFELEQHEPDVRVLGAWCTQQLLDDVSKLEPMDRQVSDHTDNPVWAQRRHEDPARAFCGGKLVQYRDTWERFGADAEVLSWLDEGYRVTISAEEEAAWSAVGVYARGIRKRNGGKARDNPVDMRVLVLQNIRKRSYEVCSVDDVDNVLPLNVAPKPGKSPPFRLIHNCIPLNPFVKLWSVRYEGLKTVPLVVAPGDWLFSIDLTEACYQLPLEETTRRLFGASLSFSQQQMQELEREGLLPEGYSWDRSQDWVTVHVRARGLPQGFRNSCAVWTKLARVLTAKWRREGIKLVHLLDDFLFSVSGSFEEACECIRRIVRDLDEAGLQVNWGKSVLTPCKCLKFLGLLVDSEAYRFFAPKEKILKLKELVAELVADRDVTTFRELARILGKILSLQIAVPAVKMLTRDSYALLRPEGEWDDSAHITEDVVQELIRAVAWVQHFNLVGNPIRRFVSKGGLVGSVGDARSLVVGGGENVWVCPPLQVLAVAVMQVLEQGIRASVVVPDWPNQPWHVLLRSNSSAMERLRWHPSSPVMVDVSDKSSIHPHLVDKWDFVAFAVGGSEQVVGVGPPKSRAARAPSCARARSLPQLRRKKRLRDGATVWNAKRRMWRPARVAADCGSLRHTLVEHGGGGV